MNKKLRRILCGLALVPLITLPSCGESTPETPTSQEVTTSDDVVKYTITWKSDGQVINTTSVKEGDIPSYEGETPTKEGNAQYSYVFKGWTPDIVVCTGDATYEAVFDRIVNKYTITFNSLGGSSIDPITADYGTTINEPTKPTREGYKFVSWAYDELGAEKVTFPFEIQEDKTLYAIWNEKVDIKKHLKTLLSGLDLSPLSYIPEAMLPTYSKNIVNKNDIPTEFSTNFVEVKSLRREAYGEQWNMVVENIEQSMMFFEVLSVVESVSATSIEVFNNYIDKNPSDTASHSFKVGTYDVTINFDGTIIAYELSFTTNKGTKTALKIDLDTTTGERTGKFQIGEANALRYIVNENKYEFALRALGVRRSYFKIETLEDGSVVGQINEHTGLDNKLDVQSAAQFYIKDDNVSVVGNKAKGMVGSKHTVVELYDAKVGRLIASEIQEIIAGIEYNTLWFNLYDFSGIENVKYISRPLGENGTADEVKPTEGDVYLNSDTENLLKTKNMGIKYGAKIASRRYDIDLRELYFNYNELDEDGKTVTKHIGVETPMLHVQEEVLDTLKEDIEKTNPKLNLKLGILYDEVKVNYLMDEYKLEIPAFNEIKEAVSQQFILDFIAQN